MNLTRIRSGGSSEQGLHPPIFEVDARHVTVTVLRPVFDDAGHKIPLKPETNKAEPNTNGTQPETMACEANTNAVEPVTKGSLTLPSDFDEKMASHCKDLRERAKLIWLRLASDANITVRELSAELHFGIASTQGALNALKESGLLIKVGNTRNCKWIVASGKVEGENENV